MSEKISLLDSDIFKLIVENINEIIFMIDDQYKIIFAAPSSSRLLGCTTAELIGKNIADIFYHEDFYHADNSLRNFLQSNHQSNLTHNWKLKNGEFISAETNISVIIDESRSAFYYLASSRLHQNKLEIAADNFIEPEKAQRTNELHNRIMEINKTVDELRKMNDAKDKLFSIISHDLRNPFDSLLGFSNIISGDYDSLTEDEIKFYALNINNSARHLLSLLDNFLQLSIIQSGNLKAVPEPIDLNSKMFEIISIFNQGLIVKKISVINNLDNNIIVWADENMLKSILQNIISNAVKFTRPEGRITISSKILDRFVEISVEDNGIGMENETITNVFDFNNIITTRGTAKEKGTGIGLTICKELIEKNHGELKIHSEQEKGTRISFSLPLNNT